MKPLWRRSACRAGHGPPVGSIWQIPVAVTQQACQKWQHLPVDCTNTAIPAKMGSVNGVVCPMCSYS